MWFKDRFHVKVCHARELKKVEHQTLSVFLWTLEEGFTQFIDSYQNVHYTHFPQDFKNSDDVGNPKSLPENANLDPCLQKGILNISTLNLGRKRHFLEKKF